MTCERRWGEMRRAHMIWDEMRCGVWSASVKCEAGPSESPSNSSTGITFWQDVPYNHIPLLKAKSRRVQTRFVKQLLLIWFSICPASIASGPKGLGSKASHRCWPRGMVAHMLVEPKFKAFGIKTLVRESCPKHDAQPVPRMLRSFSPAEP